MKHREIKARILAAMLAAALTVGGYPAVANAAEESVGEVVTSADDNQEDIVYAMMNVPYSALYKDEGVDEYYDTVSTATTQKFVMTDGLAKGTYHDGKDILGVVYPVAMSKAVYETLKNKTLTANDSYYISRVLEEAPAAYKSLTYTDGAYSFSEAKGTSYDGSTSGLTIENVTTSSSYGDYQFELAGAKTANGGAIGELSDVDFDGIILTDSTGKTYGLGMLENTWIATRNNENVKIAFSIPEGNYLKNHGGVAFKTFSGLNGATITNVKLITNKGIFSADCNVTLPVYYAGEETVSAEITDANTLSVKVPSAFENPTVTVSYREGRKTVNVAENAQIVDGTVALSGLKEEKTTYTVTVNRSNYARKITSVTYEAAPAQEEYTYVYAGLTWKEFWASEGVQAAGDDTSSEELDARNESDKGAFDTVSRATTNHGLHRGSYQCMATIYDEEGKTYEISHWSDDGKMLYLTDGSSVGYSRGTITKTDGSTVKMKDYTVTGIKYVPVKVKTEDYEAFKVAYAGKIVENGGEMFGGFSEINLNSYTASANVTENTNGLKEAVKNENGTFTFTARKTDGTESGLANTAIKAPADAITTEVKEASGSYGEFLRFDINGEGYGDLGAAMQAAKWTYYGADSSYTKALASYGTKFAADNWMHKMMGIQLGLTNSMRCALPEGTDGTGYWEVTVYALGYADTTYRFQATDANIVKPVAEELVDTKELEAVIAKAEALQKSDYTAKSWADLQTELQEAKDAIANQSTQAVVDEAKAHLESAINALVKETPKPKTGTVFADKNASYKIIDIKKSTVEYQKAKNKKAASVSIPASVKYNGVTYKVTSVAAGAFKGNKSLKKVTISANINKIGKDTFNGCKNLKTIAIKTSALTKKNVGGNAFKGTYAKATVTVPKKKVKAYKSLLQSKGLSKKAKIK